MCRLSQWLGRVSSHLSRSASREVNLIQKIYRPEPDGFVNECYDSDLKRMSKPPATEAGPEPESKIPARSEEVSVLVARVVPSIPTLSFLSSLSCNTPILRCHPQALQFMQGKKFAKTRTELTRQLYELFNREIFGAALSPSMECKWNMRLTKTAGFCCSTIVMKNNVRTRTARIELSCKVVDSPDRLRDTLVHEMAHAAAWIINGYRDGHGPLWQQWVKQAATRFPELPPIDRAHNYEIHTKFSYKCISCGYAVGRHTKSLNTARKVCGLCNGSFELVINSKKKLPVSKALTTKTSKATDF